jgi:predicted kinase
MEKNLILLRGLPGSGKSTLAKLICNQHIEADMYFLQDGKYNFDSSKLNEAHKWCQDKAEEWMKNKYNVVVSNTFTTEKELNPYYELAKKYGYKVVCLIVENRHGGVNIHGVPNETLDKMEVRLKGSIKLRDGK